MARIGHYILCAAEGQDRAASMFLSPAYAVGGWGWLRQQIAVAKTRIEAAGGTLGFAVIKYFAGQGVDADGNADPKVLDILAARDLNIAPGVVGPNPMQGRYGMMALTSWCRRRNIDLIAYVGKAPDEFEFAEFVTNDRDVEFFLGWIGAMVGLGWTFIFDSACYPPMHQPTLDFIRWIEKAGSASTWMPPLFWADGEAFPDGSSRGLWPDAAHIACWGENESWIKSGLPDSRGNMDCTANLLHIGSEATPEALAAAAQEYPVSIAMNILEMEPQSLADIVRAAKGAAGER